MYKFSRFFMILILSFTMLSCTDHDSESTITPTSIVIKEKNNYFSGVSGHQWEAPGPVARITLEIDDFHHGDVRVVVWDSRGKRIYDQLYWSYNGYWYIGDGKLYDIDFTDEGEPGIWTIELQYYDFTGDLYLVLESTTDPAPDQTTPISPPDVPSPLLDTSFGEYGIATYSSGKAFGRSIISDSQGRIIVTGVLINNDGTRQLGVWRFLANGNLDTIFGSGGLFTLESSSKSGGIDVAVDSGKNIIVTGWKADSQDMTDLLVLKLNSSGALDDTFGEAGVVTVDNGADEFGRGIVVGGSGDLFVTGTSGDPEQKTGRMILAKFSNTGILVSDFGDNGIIRSDNAMDFGWDLATDLQGSLIVLGSRNDGLILWKYTTDGQLVTSFGNNGIVTNTAGEDAILVGRRLAVMTEDDIIVTGTRIVTTDPNYTEMVLLKYNADGSPDINFNGSGILSYNYNGGSAVGTDVCIDNNRRIIVLGTTKSDSDPGSFSSVTLWRYSITGTLDASLPGSNGKGLTQFDDRNADTMPGGLMVDGEIFATGSAIDLNNNAMDLTVWNLLSD